MTIDPFPCRDTDVHAWPKTFYRTKIPVGHNQLRNLISSPQQNVVYYVNRKHVYLLDTVRKKRAHIGELPFEPRCTATGHGFFCAGGDYKGEFAYLKLPEPPSARDGGAEGPSSAYASGVDRSSTASMFDYMDLNNWHLARRPHLEHVGEEIVNSITIHCVRGDGCGTSDEVVAILTNNDHTVRWFSLTQGKQLREEKFEYPLNHASISPDGKLMIVVGDKEFAHFFECIEDACPQRKESTAGDSTRYPSHEWVLLRKLRLHKPRGQKVSCYFTTAWSESAKLCATASEHGYVSVFDTQSLRDLECDPVVALVPSSRPHTIPGAIRSMCFAPDPWDLILWTENHGRVCIGDLRTGLETRQVVSLDPSKDKVENVDLMDPPALHEDPEMRDFDMEIDFLRRHQRVLSQGDNVAAVSFATDYLAATAERRRLERQGGYSEVDPDPHGLTAEERQILAGLRTSREREEMMLRHSRSQEANGVSQERRPSPRSIVYSPFGPRSGSPASTQQFDQYRRELDARELRESALLNSIRDYMRDTARDGNGASSAERDHSAIQQPRRRDSILITPSAADATPSSSRSGTPSISSAATVTDTWRTIEAAMQRATPSLSTNLAGASTGNNAADSLEQSTTDPPGRNSTANIDEDALANAPNIEWVRRRGQLLQAPSSTPPASRSGQGSSARNTAITLPNLRERASDAALEARREALAQRAEALAARREPLAGETIAARARERERELRRDAAMLGAWEAALLRQRSGGAGARAAGDNGVGGASVDVDPAEDWGPGTTGAAFGDGGRVAYVGTEQGVFELKLDLQPRKFWPARELR